MKKFLCIVFLSMMLVGCKDTDRYITKCSGNDIEVNFLYDEKNQIKLIEVSQFVEFDDVVAAIEGKARALKIFRII